MIDLFSNDIEENDEDFNPGSIPHTNLASLFGNMSTVGNSSLVYTPQKQPKVQGKVTSSATPISSSPSGSSVIVAKTVQTFKMVDGAYQNQGRLGGALISVNTEGGTVYQVLLYRDKRHHVYSAKITKQFSFHIQPKNYCTFCDKESVVWSILFESPADMVDFTLQMAVARWRAGCNSGPIMKQDLWSPTFASDDPKSTVTAVGDTVELAYTLHTVAVDNISVPTTQAPESQQVLLEVEGVGWKQALVGMQATTQRVIILQPFLLGDLNPKEVTYNCPVMMRVTMIQVIKGRPNPPPAPTDPPAAKEEETKVVNQELPQPDPEPTVAVPEASGGTGSPKTSSKADLISRMARMGKALPFKTTPPTASDSDDTEEEKHNRVRAGMDRSVPPPRARGQFQSSQFQGPPFQGPQFQGPQHQGPQHQGPAPYAPTMVPMSVSQPPHSGTPMAITQQWAAAPYMVGNVYPTPQLQSPVESQAMHMFLSEVRTSNAELRMGITRLTDKVEALQNKFDQPERRMNTGFEMNPVLERLVENQQFLRNQLQMVVSTLQQSQPSRSSIEAAPLALPPVPSLDVCPRCPELEQSQASYIEKLKKLEEENEYLLTSTSAQKDALQNARLADQDQMSRIEALQKQLTEEQSRVSELSETISRLEAAKESVALELKEAESTIAELQSTLGEKQENIDKLEQALRDSEATKLEEVRRGLQEVMDPKPAITDHVKKILNAVYRLVKVQFEAGNLYEAPFIQSVLADTIKAVTLEYLTSGDLQLSASPSRAPTVSSSQSSVSGQYMRKEQRVSLEVEAKLSEALSSDAISQPEFSTPGQSSTDSLHSGSVLNGESGDLEKEDESKFQEDESVPVQPQSSSTSTTVSAAPVPESVDDSFENVWRPKPPPPPLFNDEEDDDWFNS